MIVFKFGGKSLENSEKIYKIAKYIKKRLKNEKIIVVVSAMGDTTDNLLNLARTYSKRPDGRELDMLLSCGEAISCSVLAIKLKEMKVKCESLLCWQAGIFAEGNYGNCKITKIDKNLLENKLKEFDCLIVAGFQALNERGDIVTLGRGGSDTTAVALGGALDAMVEIYSDFDGIFAGDPRRLNYKKYKNVDYETIRRYAKAGAKVLSASSTDIILKNDVKVVCKSSGEPTKSGTFLVKQNCDFIGICLAKNEEQLKLVFSKNSKKVQKNIDFLTKNAKFCDFFVKNDQIVIFGEIEKLKILEEKLAKFNHLLK